MNKNQIKGKTKEVAGEIQKQAGKILGSKSQEVKGHNKKLEGSMQKQAGDVQESVKQAQKSTKH